MTNSQNTQNVPTTQAANAWHSRAAGDLCTWADGYSPSSERAAAVWKAHRAELEPRISAAPAAGVTEARRIASAVLELLAWAMPLVNDLDQALSEDSLQRFLRANPTGLGDGALGNVRGRVRRVLKARAGLDAASTADEATTALRASETEDSQSSSSKEQAPTDASSQGYSEEIWSLLVAAAQDDALLARALNKPDDMSASAWAHARAAAIQLGVNLTKAQVARTQHVRALSHPMRGSLSEVLRDLGATRRTATEAASLLPTVGDAVCREILREGAGPAAEPHSETGLLGDCTTASPEHRDGRLDATTEDEAPAHPAPGGSFTVSTIPHYASPQSTQAETASQPPAPARRRRKPSARQMRLALAAANAERETRTDSMPDSMRTYIREVYIPLEAAVRPHWDELKGAVEATLAASSVRGEDSMRKHVTHLAYFFHWARTVALPLESSTLTRTNVGRYDSEVLVDAGGSTRQTRRSRLMAMADQIHPDDAPVKGPPLAHRSVAAPYSLSEMAVIRRVAQVQPTRQLVRQLCLLVGLGAGAGIDSTDIKRLRDSDVTDHGPDKGIEVHVTNLRRSKDNTEKRTHRTVWVLREYEDMVRIGLEGARRGHLLLGRDAERANVAASVFARAVLSKEVPELAQARLRSTWLATHLQRTTPLNVLLQAAGLTTARTLVELLEHLPKGADAAALR
ncbi:hypothetical protein [Nocardioides sp. zg-1228]|uniref:hypothetical protein n=1 Tax=Nocardioides sp. zg-1228 TaxID=2763008 RepID=UPI0016424C8C|nr:hypothetical protein [Nocardioides sp. zg-1228]MBC2933087.1 hypothetical protein [Nocardioides sp. zg-1228]QSF56724.1 hypothetical protein JX575_14065 [Nocardioides sp. zg-1228]